MWQYNNTDELYHYGVLGMKWGVRRATKRLNAAKASGDKEKTAKALSKLDKHKGKITKKITKLNKQGEELEKEKFKVVTKSDVKAAELDAEISRLRNKANKAWTMKKTQKLNEKADVLTLKVNKIKAKSNEVKTKIEKNKALTNTFSRTLSDVDSILIANGKKYIR